MKIKIGVLLIALLSTMVWAQDQSAPQGPGPGGPPMGMHGPRGGFQWWKNSETVSKLNLSSTQVSQLDQIFTQHKTNLKTVLDAMRTADTNLRKLLDADNPDQNQVMTAANQVLAARGNLERDATMMMLEFRKVLTADQWKQLRAMHPMGPGFGGPMMHGRRRGGMGGPGGPGLPPPPPDDDGPAPQD